MDDFTAEAMYREHILDNYNNPRNYGSLENADVVHNEFNPLCGDVIEIQLKVNEDAINDIKFKGKGCAISQASASLLTEHVKGKNITETNNITRDDIIELLGIPIGPVRIKCAVLSMIALKECIKKLENGKNT